MDFPQRDQLLSTVVHGVMHSFNPSLPPETSCPIRNHKSATVMANALVRSVREGQANGTYLVLDLSILQLWPNIQLSPFGCVEKKDADPNLEARLIHDLSFPLARSTNTATQSLELPSLNYAPVHAIAARIDYLAHHHPNQRIRMLKGDVKGAFRHIPVAAATARWFGGVLPDQNAVVIDVALPFGWKGSPAHYGVFGRAISFLLSRESPYSMCPSNTDMEPFFSYEWVDDHILVEIDTEDRLIQCENALWLSMLAVLGPHAINESKFSTWTSELVALGLTWNTDTRTVSMPDPKIAKALDRVVTCLEQSLHRKHNWPKSLGACAMYALAFPQRGPSTNSSSRYGDKLILIAVAAFYQAPFKTFTGFSISSSTVASAGSHFPLCVQP